MKKKITFSNVIYLLLGISLIYHTFLTILFFVQYHTTPMRKIGRLMNGVIILLLVVWFLYYYVIKKEKDKVNSVLKKYMIKENMFLLLFFLWIYFGCFRKMIVSGSIFMGGNSLYLITVGIKLFLAFLFAQYVNGNKKILHILFRFLIVGLTIAMLFVLYQLVLNRGFAYHNSKCFINILVGFEGDKTFGRLRITVNPNSIGMYAKTIIMLCVYMFFEVKNRFRYVYVGAGVIHYIILVFTDCRAAILSLAVGLGLIAAFYWWDRLYTKKMGIRILVAALVFLFSFGLVDSMRRPTVYGYKILRSWVTGEKLDLETGKRDLLKNSSGRGPIYLAAIRSMRHPEAAVFGATPDGIIELLDNEMEKPLHLYSHNEFLEVMCATGIPGLLLFLGWLGLSAWDGARVFFNVKKKFTFSERVLMMICLVELANNMMEAQLTFYSNLSGMIFYLTAGYAVVFAQRLNHSGEEINNK